MKHGISVVLVLFAMAVHCASSNCNVSESECECSGTTEEDLGSAYSNCTKLTITDSPNLSSILSLPAGLTELYLIRTGLLELKSNAIGKAESLQKLFIREAPIRKIDLGRPTNWYPQLHELTVVNCTSLADVTGISRYHNLGVITISSTGLKTIDEDMFEDLYYVTSLDLSYNYNLYHIDEDAFDDLFALESLTMTGCALTKLYDNYFHSIYENNGVARTLLNPLQCYEMCDFMEWYWDHRSFYHQSYLGTCTIPYSDGVYVYSVYELSRYTAGCPPILGIILGCVFGGLVLICVLGCIFSVLCGFNYKKYCCCCSKSRRNREEVTSQNNGNEDYIDFYTINQMKPALPMYSDIPPKYEELAIPNGENNNAYILDNTHTSSST